MKAHPDVTTITAGGPAGSAARRESGTGAAEDGPVNGDTRPSEAGTEDTGRVASVPPGHVEQDSGPGRDVPRHATTGRGGLG